MEADIRLSLEEQIAAWLACVAMIAAFETDPHPEHQANITARLPALRRAEQKLEPKQ